MLHFLFLLVPGDNRRYKAEDRHPRKKFVVFHVFVPPYRFPLFNNLYFQTPDFFKIPPGRMHKEAMILQAVSFEDQLSSTFTSLV